MKRTYSTNEKITVADLEGETLLNAKRCTSNEFNLSEDVTREELPTEPGLVVFRLQRNKDAHGFIRVRWGKAFQKGSIAAEFGDGGLESM